MCEVAGIVWVGELRSSRGIVVIWKLIIRLETRLRIIISEIHLNLGNVKYRHSMVLSFYTGL